jgi:beta-lactamase regulating signal transducer with metallopeptidase domain
MEANMMQHLNSTAPAEWLIASIWQGVVLTALAWAVLKVAAGLRASTRFALWLVVFLLVALLPGFAIVRGLISASLAALPAVPATHLSLNLNHDWAFALEAIWLAASLFSLGRLLVSLHEMRRLLRSSDAVEALAPEVLDAVSRPGKRAVEVRLSDAIDSPSVVGFFRPTIVVPRAVWSELAPSDLRQVLLHEMAHLQRGDDWINLLQKLLKALCPLNPALLWVERQLCREREQACDDAVLDRAGNAKAYALCLTKLAESRLVRRVSALAPGMWQRRSELAGRVENILHRRTNLAPWLTRGLVTAGFAASMFGAAVLQRVPGMVTFSSYTTEAAATHVPAALFDEHQASLIKAQYEKSQLTHAQYHEAVFHPDMSATGERASLLPKHNSKRQVRSSRHLQLPSTPAAKLMGTQVQVSPDPGSGVFTLILFTVEVPQTSQDLHGVSRSFISTTNHWIEFQI